MKTIFAGGIPDVREVPIHGGNVVGGVFMTDGCAFCAPACVPDVIGAVDAEDFGWVAAGDVGFSGESFERGVFEVAEEFIAAIFMGIPYIVHAFH